LWSASGALSLVRVVRHGTNPTARTAGAA
jgi:hypothetical protein